MTNLPANIQSEIKRVFAQIKKTESPSSITPNTKVVSIRFKTLDGLGVGIFLDQSGQLILDETSGMEVQPSFTHSIESANTYGALRAYFGWN
jgi:hypothetical protein